MTFPACPDCLFALYETDDGLKCPDCGRTATEVPA